MQKLLKRKLVDLAVMVAVTAVFVIVCINQEEDDVNTNIEVKNIPVENITKELNKTDTAMVNNLSKYNETIGKKKDTKKKDVNNGKELDRLVYIVDNLCIISSAEVSADTATETEYTGKIKIDTTAINITELDTSKTYKVIAEPLISMSNPPEIIAISIDEASEYDLGRLDKIRSNISNYEDLKIKYNSMGLDSIIENANENYICWTQAERIEYVDFIKSLGYTDDNAVKNKVFINGQETVTSEVLE